MCRVLQKTHLLRYLSLARDLLAGRRSTALRCIVGVLSKEGLVGNKDIKRYIFAAYVQMFFPCIKMDFHFFFHLILSHFHLAKNLRPQTKKGHFPFLEIYMHRIQGETERTRNRHMSKQKDKKSYTHQLLTGACSNDDSGYIHLFFL